MSLVITVAAVVFRDGDRRMLTVRRASARSSCSPAESWSRGSRPRRRPSAVAEELGVRLGVKDLTLLGEFEADAANEPGHLVRSTVFTWAGEVAPDAAAEIAELRWATPRHHRRSRLRAADQGVRRPGARAGLNPDGGPDGGRLCRCARVLSPALDGRPRDASAGRRAELGTAGPDDRWPAPRLFVGTAQHTAHRATPYTRLALTARLMETVFLGAGGGRPGARVHGEAARTRRGKMAVPGGRAHPEGSPYAAADPGLMMDGGVALDSVRVHVRRLGPPAPPGRA